MRKGGFGLLLLAAAIAGCKDNALPGCRLAESVVLAASPLTLMKEVSLQRAGASFVLLGSDGDSVRWAPLGLDGTLGAEATLTLPQRALRPEPWFGATAKSGSGDQVIVAYVAPKAGSTSQLQIVAVAQSPGGPPSAPTVLADLPAGVDPKIVRLAMGTSRTGQRAVLAWGFEGQDASPQLLVLKGDAQPVGAPIAVRQGPGVRWTCLDVDTSRTDFGVSVLEAGSAGTAATWRTFELRDDGSRGPDVGIELDVVPTGCVSSSPTAHGYVIAYQDNDGTYFSDYDIERANVNTKIIAGVLRFGGAARQPTVACLSPMGLEYSLLFERDTGPEVWRFNAGGVPQGASLLLPSGGSVGPLSAVSGSDAFYATYLDQRPGVDASVPTDGNSTGNSRQLVRVECPMAIPAVTVDAGTADGGK
jgi:hypothetical protein